MTSAVAVLGAFPLAPGDRGEAIRDLQRRLVAAGFLVDLGGELGSYGGATTDAVAAFQLARGLRVDGRCDTDTWASLIEASWLLGDRPLLLTAPNLRGDDVADLQSRLAKLGFDCGRIDGILGPRTAAALRSFQADCGLPDDGVCGPTSTQALRRVSSQSGNGPGVAALREREGGRSLHAIADCRIVVGHAGGLSSVARTLTRELRLRGATVMTLDEPDPVTQALAANGFAADVFLGFEACAEPISVAHFYQVPSFESTSGRALAEALAMAIAASELALELMVSGKRLAVLRETRMPAVLCRFGPPRLVSEAATTLSEAAIAALNSWVSRSR